MVATRSSKTEPAAELGKWLSSARQRHKLSVAQVAEQLKMSRRHIEAIEEGDFSVFAAELYARGACLTYARFLELDSKESERAVWRALSSGRKPVPLKIHTAFSWVERLFTARVVLWLAGAVVVLIIGGYILWQVQSFWRAPMLQLSQNLPAVAKDSHITVAGKTERDARLTINDEPVLLQADASFSQVLQLHPGINVIKVEAHNVAGRKSTLEQHILLPRS